MYMHIFVHAFAEVDRNTSKYMVLGTCYNTWTGVLMMYKLANENVALSHKNTKDTYIPRLSFSLLVRLNKINSFLSSKGLRYLTGISCHANSCELLCWNIYGLCSSYQILILDTCKYFQPIQLPFGSSPLVYF